MNSWQPAASVPVSCSVIKQDVMVEISSLDVYGQGQFPIDQARRMDACSGSHICKLFPHPHAFHTRGPYGCPYHARLNGG
jgi:hypothetical protein